MPQVEITPTSVRLLVSAAETSAWAANWPLSRIRGHRLRADFDVSGSLVDYALDGRHPATSIPSDEFNALTSDMLRTRLPATHPAYFGCVGQFDAARRSR
jgi:hypothetical protein